MPESRDPGVSWRGRCVEFCRGLRRRAGGDELALSVLRSRAAAARFLGRGGCVTRAGHVLLAGRRVNSPACLPSRNSGASPGRGRRSHGPGLRNIARVTARRSRDKRQAADTEVAARSLCMQAAKAELRACACDMWASGSREEAAGKVRATAAGAEPREAVTNEASRVPGSGNPWGPLAARGGASHGRWLVQAPARPQLRGKARRGEALPLPLPPARPGGVCGARAWLAARAAPFPRSATGAATPAAAAAAGARWGSPAPPASRFVLSDPVAAPSPPHLPHR
ncbi:uncharacterized protein LOC126153714 [Schistocerca cancellata]|uniref:uncharacterized protein LOC126153714 n=1 Tax=Schistocerca cancellata TaxID=274614 RepID=UPI00211783A6|nr:uncharacterized protein LOC126153714 [Schistocerca cancellata]